MFRPEDPPKIEDYNGLWACQKPVYEWKEEFTEGSAPIDLELETELFGDDRRVQAGVHFDKYSRISVRRKGGPDRHTPISSFEEAGLHPTIMDNIRRMKYVAPTPIQKNAIPLLMAGYDLLACSQTGSGKTAAFLLPVLSKILSKIARSSSPTRPRPGARWTKASPQALILLPTRELGIQIFDEARRFTYMSRIRPVVIYGGADLRIQREQLLQGCDLLIATPGRLVDAMERGMVALDKVRQLILDEADRILDMGFETTIREILCNSDLPRDETLHMMMFSATFPSQIQVLARDFMKEDYCRLRMGRIGGTTTNILQKVIKVDELDKEQTLVDLLYSQPPSRTLIFVGSKRMADYLDDILYNQKFPCISLHGDRSQREREQALEAFKSGRSPILIATSIAARGLDIKNVLHVINYDLCDDIDDYVHRIGRTARAGNPGLATTFYTDRNYVIAPHLVKLLIECEQEVPEFLQPYITEESSEENDFVDPDTYDTLKLEQQQNHQSYNGHDTHNGAGVHDRYQSSYSESNNQSPSYQKAGLGDRYSGTDNQYSSSQKMGLGDRYSEADNEYGPSQKAGSGGRFSNVDSQYPSSQRAELGDRYSDVDNGYKSPQRAGLGDRLSNMDSQYPSSQRAELGDRYSDVDNGYKSPQRAGLGDRLSSMDSQYSSSQRAGLGDRYSDADNGYKSPQRAGLGDRLSSMDSHHSPLQRAGPGNRNSDAGNEYNSSQRTGTGGRNMDPLDDLVPSFEKASINNRYSNGTNHDSQPTQGATPSNNNWAPRDDRHSRDDYPASFSSTNKPFKEPVSPSKETQEGFGDNAWLKAPTGYRQEMRTSDWDARAQALALGWN